MAEKVKSREEKRTEMFKDWVSGEGVQFKDDQAKEAYQKRAGRIWDAVELKEPDRVPVIPMTNFFPAFHAGHTCESMMYDFDKLEDAMKSYVFDFEPDAFMGSMLVGPPGDVFEQIGFKLYNWPGHGAPENTSYQAVEKEYMKPEEYDHLINDPSDFWLRKYLPRIASELEPLEDLLPVTNVLELFIFPYLMPFGTPEVQSVLNTLMEVGEKTLAWQQRIGEIDGQIIGSGYPILLGGFAKAPFDVIADTKRGTSGVMVDIMRRPDKLKKAMEQITPTLIQSAVGQAKMNNNPFVFIPLHKGADSFMSRDQFREFYWPGLQTVITSLTEEGLVPVMFVEGSYNERLDIIKDVPERSTIWMFDATDMEDAREELGGTACIQGNVSSSLLITKTAEGTKNYCKELIDNVAPGGGYILSNGAAIDNAEDENVQAMIETAKEYGGY